MRKFDLSDLIFFTGLAVVGVGLWMLAPWLSLTAIGVVLMAFGAVGS